MIHLHAYRGVTLFQQVVEVGVPIFVSFRSFFGAAGVGCENFSLLTLEKARFGAYPMHSDVLILKLWFAVHRMLQG